MNALKRLSLGQDASIGALYNAHNDTFLDTSLLLASNNSPIPVGGVVTTDLHNTSTKSEITTGTIKEKLDRLGVSPELGASLLAGLVSPGGSARYLAQQDGTVPTAQGAVVHTVTSRMEQLSFLSDGVRERLNLDVLRAPEAAGATHVLTGITWGARAVISLRQRAGDGMGTSQCEPKLDVLMKRLLALDEKASQEKTDIMSSMDDSIHLRLYTDARETSDEHVDNSSIIDGVEHFTQLKTHVETTGGKPLVYTLLPIAFLVTLGAVVSEDTTASQLSPECYEELVGLFDHMNYLQRTMNAHHQRLLQQRELVSDLHLSEVEDTLRKVRDADADLQARYIEALKNVREHKASSQSVSNLIDTVLDDVPSPRELASLTVNYERKLEFLSKMVGLGAIQAGEAQVPLREVIDRNSAMHRTMYAFHFSNDSIDPSSATWNDNLALLEELLTKGHTKPHVLLVDYGSYGEKLTQVCVSVHAHGTMVVENLLDQNKELAGKHLVRYEQLFLESTKDLPSYRKSLRLPCPGPSCDSQEICLWTCCECQEAIEFGSRDGYFYCDCGRVPFDKVEFDCQGPSHELGYYRHGRNHLRHLLQNLPAPREVNILILGETGVGKSTFVNAFVNYLTFGSLDEGLQNPRLNCIVPCSFTTQIIDEGRMISKDVIIGSDSDEADGSKGQSATQKATVYPLYFKDTIIRLIDTPGIGDTRGLEQDKQNMANMLSILRNYPALHGILILLKPNNARLGVMFRFCVKELLTHLHTSAAQNMVFGFTNTRGSNYTPGDTFKPLEALLSEYHNVIPQLSTSNVYCFDSESFRYLAARKQGIEMGHIEDYRHSWEHSSKEAGRLLAHFQSLHPHHTQETLSLNETRHLIAQLTAPMQQISVAITDTIGKSEQQVLDLKNAKLTDSDLKSKLYIHKTTVKAKQLEKPKTVCSNESCVESAFDEGTKSEVLLRKKLCHNPCCLINVPVGKVGTPQLENCAAFRGASCTQCGHHWKEHEHILVEYSKRKETVADPTVQHELTTNGSVIRAKEKAIQALQKHIADLKEEHRQVQTTAAKFSLYLKNNSITHYNDATIEYLEHLIKDERTKVRTGQSRARLEFLERDLDDYRKFVETMEQGKNGGENGQVYVPLNEAGVAKLVQTLYNLPHYGQMLKDLAQVVANAYEANFRERPYRINRKKYWREQREVPVRAWSPFGRRTSVRNSGWGWENPFSRAWGTENSSSRVSPAMGNPSARHPVMPGSFDSGSSGGSGNSSPTSSGPTSNHNDFTLQKCLPTPSGTQRDHVANSWPSSEKQGSSHGPVQSIMSWDESSQSGGSFAAAAPVTQNPFPDSLFPVPAPPPYPGPHSSYSDSPSNNPVWQPPQIDVVERRGVWVRLKSRLKKR